MFPRKFKTLTSAGVNCYRNLKTKFNRRTGSRAKTNEFKTVFFIKKPPPGYGLAVSLGLDGFSSLGFIKVFKIGPIAAICCSCLLTGSNNFHRFIEFIPGLVFSEEDDVGLLCRSLTGSFREKRGENGFEEKFPNCLAAWVAKSNHFPAENSLSDNSMTCDNREFIFFNHSRFIIACWISL